MLKEDNEIFHPISLEDRDWITQKLKEDDNRACEYTFANNFMWSDVYEIWVGKINDCGVIRYKKNGSFNYCFPFGNGDKENTIKLLRKICAGQNYKLSLYPVLEEDRKKLLEWFPGEFEVDAYRSDFDYVYTVEKLSTLRGKKLQGKRNHIARFMDDVDWSYEKLNKENMDGCREMAKSWIDKREDKWNADMEREMQVLEKALTYFDELGLFGGVLKKKGEIVAFTVGEPLNSDTMVVHFEKAFPEIKGAYPMINQQFVIHEGNEFTYVNREEDTGDLGLRKAKLSYCPDILLKKYTAVESKVVFANETQQDQIMEIWRQCFKDTKEYVQMYLDKRFETENMMVIHDAGKLVSMASFFPAQITINGKQRNARYVYAVATLPEYRGRGYASKIINHAAEKYKEPLILQPANEMLEQFYKTIGFEKVSMHGMHFKFENPIKQQNKKVNKLTEIDLEKWDVSLINASEYKRLRDAYFSGEGYVEWDEKAIQYAIEENEFCGGQALKLTFGENEKLLMYCVENDEIYIKETTMEEAEIYKLMPEIMNKMGAKGFFTLNAGCMILLPSNITWKEKKGYLNLTLG